MKSASIRITMYVFNDIYTYYRRFFKQLHCYLYVAQFASVYRKELLISQADLHCATATVAIALYIVLL